MKELKIGDMVRLRMSNWFGIVVEEQGNSFYIHWSNGRGRWETKSVLQLVARC